ncbi:hypothetical protein APY04_3298 [Hyphomicrobium sulfonivorans]|uniref:Uncharacterized protein n=1 Tax=Hyphomicrobium sulfonivorans TaxID=121290 RepID=A0A109B8S0_HYPSL|nr:hypothetical protein APY04_3298 [Hyphomicrobium sulfonivorans]
MDPRPCHLDFARDCGLPRADKSIRHLPLSLDAISVASQCVPVATTPNNVRVPNCDLR